jgi:hypothetical protein
LHGCNLRSYRLVCIDKWPLAYHIFIQNIIEIKMRVSTLVFIIVVKSVVLWTCQGSFLSLWETTCKAHADSKHQELKEILKNHENFNSSSWSHSILMVLLIIISGIATIICCFMCYQCRPPINCRKSTTTY